MHKQSENEFKPVIKLMKLIFLMMIQLIKHNFISIEVQANLKLRHLTMVVSDTGKILDCKASPKLFIIMGCPGVGKGTLIKRLLSEFADTTETKASADTAKPKFNYIEMGAIIREKAKTSPEIKAKIDAGDLITDEEAYEIVKERIHLNENNKLQEITILDGFPRNLMAQSFMMHNFHLLHPSIPIEVIEIVADDETCMKRVMKRAEIEGRADDQGDIIVHRFVLYFQVAEQMKGFFNSVMKVDLHKVENIDLETAYSKFKEIIMG